MNENNNMPPLEIPKTPIKKKNTNTNTNLLKPKKPIKYCIICNVVIKKTHKHMIHNNDMYCINCYDDLMIEKNFEKNKDTLDLPSDKPPKVKFIIMKTTTTKKNDDEYNDEYNGEYTDDYTGNYTDIYNDYNDYNDNDNDNDNNDDNNDETKNTDNNLDFNTLFLKSIINRLNNIDKCDDSSCDNSNSSKSKKIKKTDKKHDNKNNDNKNNYENCGIDFDDYDYEKTLEYEWLGSDIKDIDDLIRIGKTYNSKKRKRYNLNLKRLNMLVEPLIELKNMIGMVDVKKIIFDQIIYYLQKLDDKNVDMLHTVIVGPPGVGKTQLTHIIAKIYNKLGFLKTDNVVCAKRDDLIAEYVGQTAPKTRKVLEKALGGVLLLDEVYALSPNSEKDFAREAIDMINIYLSEHAHDLVCVVAGYKKSTYENFLSQNEGLARRFTHHFEIKGYTGSELSLIFKKYVEEQKWSLFDEIDKIIPIIEKNLSSFPNFGGDMTTLFACCKKTHSKRLLMIPTEIELNDTKKKLTLLDIEKGIKLFLDIKEKSGLTEDDKSIFMNMYT